MHCIFFFFCFFWWGGGGGFAPDFFFKKLCFSPFLTRGGNEMYGNVCIIFGFWRLIIYLVKQKFCKNKTEFRTVPTILI